MATLRRKQRHIFSFFFIFPDDKGRMFLLGALAETIRMATLRRKQRHIFFHLYRRQREGCFSARWPTRFFFFFGHGIIPRIGDGVGSAVLVPCTVSRHAHHASGSQEQGRAASDCYMLHAVSWTTCQHVHVVAFSACESRSVC